MASPLSPRHVFDDPLASAILVLELLELPRLRDLKPAVVVLSAGVRLLGDPVAAADLAHAGPRDDLLQAPESMPRARQAEMATR
jgi:hypothetical protein